MPNKIDITKDGVNIINNDSDELSVKKQSHKPKVDSPICDTDKPNVQSKKHNKNVIDVNTVKNRKGTKDSFSSTILQGIRDIEKVIGISDEVACLEFREFETEFKNIVKSTSQVSRLVGWRSKYTTGLCTLAISTSFANYNRIAKIDIREIELANQVCNVLEGLLYKMEGMSTQDIRNKQLKRARVIKNALIYTDSEMNQAYKVLTYRLLRVVYMLIMINDYPSASLISNIILKDAEEIYKLNGGRKCTK